MIIISCLKKRWYANKNSTIKKVTTKVLKAVKHYLINNILTGGGGGGPLAEAGDGALL